MFYKAVRKELIERGMTYTDLAKELNISVSYISALLTGAKDNEHQRKRIAEYLGLEVEDEETDEEGKS